MEIIVGNASYPTPRIEENSHEYRPLGLGYANLGALLMHRGIPYDSEVGRSIAAALTSLMTGRAYHQSARIAAVTGPFRGYPENEQPFLEGDAHASGCGNGDRFRGCPGRSPFPGAAGLGRGHRAR